MSYKCSVCGKGTVTGNTISHANNHTKRVFKPNLQRVKVIVDGTVMHRKVCTKCIRGRRIQKAL